MQAGLSLLAVFAHPDDEALAAGGTLARYAAEGVDVRLICATRGEAGSTGRPVRCPRELLGLWRTCELERSCRALGTAEPVFLDGRDSALAAEPAGLVRQLVAAIRRSRPQVVVTWGPDGLTGHPDHLVLHWATTTACAVAADPLAFADLTAAGLCPHQPARLCYCALPASAVAALDTRLPGELNGRRLELTGVDDDQIGAALDVRAYAHRKVRALACHETQQHDFGRLSPRDLARLCAREYFVLAGGSGGREVADDLFSGLRERVAVA